MALLSGNMLSTVVNMLPEGVTFLLIQPGVYLATGTGTVLEAGGSTSFLRKRAMTLK